MTLVHLSQFKHQKHIFVVYVYIFHLTMCALAFSVLPGIPQRINAEEISRPTENICIVVVVWDPPANTAGADIDRYIVYVPSRDISNTVSSTISTLTIWSCGDDLHVQVAAVNRLGCVGMNSSVVRPILLDIPTEGGSANTISTAVDGSLSE